MNQLISAIILGIIEGFTEFLPISSTGHLIIANQWFKLEGQFSNIFNVVIQLGAILSVIIYFRDKLNPFAKNKIAGQKWEIIALWKNTIIGVIPALVLGVIFGDVIEERLFNPLTVSITLFIGGIVLIWIENRKKTSRMNAISDITYKDAFLIGIFQCLAMIPGTSRSAATIIGGMLIGSSRKVAAEFSFFLAIPTMFAASAYSLLKGGTALTAQQWQILLAGFVVSFLVAWGVIAVFMNYIRKKDFKLFGYYRIVLGILVMLLLINQ
ncbi:MAG: undecaprenyl-diphosphatase [Clostridia bacterium]|jgi:undecaprenyl-diphosphatase|nr:undecaprenyl-diphosphatase [Clostridia bacterium]